VPTIALVPREIVSVWKAEPTDVLMGGRADAIRVVDAGDASFATR